MLYCLTSKRAVEVKKRGNDEHGSPASVVGRPVDLFVKIIKNV